MSDDLQVIIARYISHFNGLAVNPEDVETKRESEDDEGSLSNTHFIDFNSLKKMNSWFDVNPRYLRNALN